MRIKSSRKHVAQACGSRTQTFNSQLTANDDVAASARFQLESIGVRTVDLASKLGLLVANTPPDVIDDDQK